MAGHGAVDVEALQLIRPPPLDVVDLQPPGQRGVAPKLVAERNEIVGRSEEGK